MANGFFDPRRDDLGKLERAERDKKVEEGRRAARLASLKRAKKFAGKAGETAGGEVAGRGAQAATFLGGAPVKAAGAAGSPFTFGTTGAAATAATTAAEQAAYQAGKRGVGRPLGKRFAQASFRPVIAYEKRRLERTQAERRELQEALAAADQDGGRPLTETIMWKLFGLGGKTALKTVSIPLELVVGIMVSIFLILLLFVLPVILVTTIL